MPYTHPDMVISPHGRLKNLRVFLCGPVSIWSTLPFAFLYKHLLTEPPPEASPSVAREYSWLEART